MIATIFEEGQGLGNQLWTYCVARSLAQKLAVEFAVFDPEKFKGHQFLSIDTQNCFSSEILNSNFENESWAVFNEETFWDQELQYFSSAYDRRVLDISRDTIIRGFFQSEKYFFGDLSKIKTYIELRPSFANKSLVDEDTCVIYIRGGEYKRFNNLILPDSYWEKAIENMQSQYGIKKFIGISDDDVYFKKVLPSIDLLPGFEADDFAALYQARYAIIANSSWGYFPIKMSNNKRCVIAPMHFARFANQFNRWASVSNVYQDWIYQNKHGDLQAYDVCQAIADETEEYYQQNFEVRTSRDAVNRKLQRFIPRSLKRSLKWVLSKFFPKKFGL